MNTISPTTSFGRCKGRLLVRATSLCTIVTFAVTFFATPMITFADGGVNDVTILGTVTSDSQVKLAPNMATDPQNHLPLFQFRVTPSSNGQSIDQGAWVVVKWKNVDCNGNQLQPSIKMGFGTLNGDNVTYGQGFNKCDSGQNGDIKNDNQVTLANTNNGHVNRNASAKFVGSLVKPYVAPTMVTFDLSPKGYSLVNGQLQNTLRDGDWFVVSIANVPVFAMYRVKGNQDMAKIGDGVEYLPASANVKAGDLVPLSPNDGKLSPQSSGGIISWKSVTTSKPLPPKVA